MLPNSHFMSKSKKIYQLPNNLEGGRGEISKALLFFLVWVFFHTCVCYGESFEA